MGATARRDPAELVLWITTGVAGVALLLFLAVAVWAYTSPNDGTDAAGMAFASAVLCGLGAFALRALTGLIALVMRYDRLVADRPAPPGWYPEQTSPTGHRYWDGVDWTASIDRP